MHKIKRRTKQITRVWSIHIWDSLTHTHTLTSTFYTFSFLIFIIHIHTMLRCVCEWERESKNLSFASRLHLKCMHARSVYLSPCVYHSVFFSFIFFYHYYHWAWMNLSFRFMEENKMNITRTTIMATTSKRKTGSNDKPDIQRKCRGSIVVLVRFSINCIFDTWREQQQQQQQVQK